MIAIPAIDLREGACVQLVGGVYARERIRMPDPLAAVRRWSDLGFRRLHVVDLDAATGRGSNAPVVSAVIALASELGMEAQAGGGVRDDDDVRRLLEAGAHRVVVGTRAIEDPGWLARMAARFPGRLILAADVRRRRVLVGGWMRDIRRNVLDVVRPLDALPLAAVLVTAVDREGRLAGPDLPLVRAVVAGTRLPVIAAGGVTTLEDLRSLAGSGVAGAIIGMAFYAGVLDARAAVEEFAT